MMRCFRTISLTRLIRIYDVREMAGLETPPAKTEKRVLKVIRLTSNDSLDVPRVYLLLYVKRTSWRMFHASWFG